MRSNEINKKIYEDRRAVASCSVPGPLQPPEVRMLVEYRDTFWGRRILDLGCGAGRTTAYLKEFTPDYTGADYSSAMIEACRRRFPDVRLVHADARRLDEFKDEEFDFVLFSFNGIDSMPHEDRLKALAEIHRVLADTGLFVFSSHNRSFRAARSDPRLRLSTSLRIQLHYIRHFLRCRRNRRRNRRYECATPEYAIVNDEAHDFALLNYYIDREHQIQQLGRFGFEVLSALDTEGRTLGPADSDDHSAWIYYACRKTD